MGLPDTKVENKDSKFHGYSLEDCKFQPDSTFYVKLILINIFRRHFAY